jgi:hypothetical protein
VLLIGTAAGAGSISVGLLPGDFEGAVLETFTLPGNDRLYGVTSYDFGNGLTYQLQTGGPAIIGRGSPGDFGMGDDPGVSYGVHGFRDGYFRQGTNPTPVTFEFAFSEPVSTVGFYGAECRWDDGADFCDGQLDVEFYGPGEELIDSLSISTARVFAWDQFHGFSSPSSINSVVFRDSGHMVLDELRFIPAPIPEPHSAVFFGVGALLVGAATRRSA